MSEQMESYISSLEESGRWRARDVTYWGGTWERVSRLIPTFKICAFKTTADGSENPYMKSVVRQPQTQFETEIAVGVVSNTYTLAQHREVVERCLKGIESTGVQTSKLRCELGLTELGEWMNMRIYFPSSYDYEPVKGDKLELRLEVFNSVDGSSRLVILLGWFRLVCANGMVIGDTKVEMRDVHNASMNLDKIPKVIRKGIDVVAADTARLNKWARTKVTLHRVEEWVNTDVVKSWGIKAACRVFHICHTGEDVEVLEPFVAARPTNKAVRAICKVPGTAEGARTLFDVSQALSWVATNRRNSEERVIWQSGIPALVSQLADCLGRMRVRSRYSSGG